jgi:hypothetical protein
MRISRWLVIIAALAVLLRVGVAVYLGDTTPPAKDETSYSMLAERLSTGHGYSFAADWYPFAHADTPTSHWSFLYTAVVGAVYSAAGTHPLAVRVLQAILSGLLMPWLTYRLTLRIFPATSVQATLPLLAALLAAVYAYFVLYGAMVQTEALFFCVILWSLERTLALDARLAAQTHGSRIGWTALTLGISLGLATLLRQSVLPWLPLLCLWLLLTSWRAQRLRTGVAAVALITAVVVFCIVPFTLRNLQAYGEFLLLNSNTGYAMYSAQHPLHGTDFQAYAAAPLPADLLDKNLNEAQWDRALMQRGLGFVLAEPGRYLLLSLSRVADYFEILPNAGSSLLFNAGQLLSFVLFLPFMLLGIFIALHRRSATAPGRRWPLPDPVGLCLLFVVFYSLLHIFTWAMPRYRLPVDAVLLPFAALGLLTAWHGLRRLTQKHTLASLPDAEASS